VFKANLRSKRYVVLDGRHRLHAAFRIHEAESVSAVLVTGDSQVAAHFAIVVNTLNGRSTRDPAYLAAAMRLLREQGLSIPSIAKMFGFSDKQVQTITRRSTQAERVRKLLGRNAGVRAITLDLVAQVEDDHLRILGDSFLDAPKAIQEDAVRDLRAASSEDRLPMAREILGRLQAEQQAKHKVKATRSRPATRLQDGLQRLIGVPDPRSAYDISTDHQKAIIRSNLDVVFPRLGYLWESFNGHRADR